MAKSGELGSESVSEYPWWSPDEKSTEISFTKRDDMDNNGITVVTQQRGLINGLVDHDKAEIERLERKNGMIYEIEVTMPMGCLRLGAESDISSAYGIVPNGHRDY